MRVNALQMFDKYGKSKFGRWFFSRVVCFKAPYFASISPTIERLERGLCVASMQQRRRVQNHIGTVHAIALCNLAELTAGVVAEASIPKGSRWIPKGMTVRYLAKASGRMTATTRVPLFELGEVGAGKDMICSVDIKDPSGKSVLGGEITMWVTALKAS